MGGFSVRTEGFKEVEAKLSALAGDVAENVARDGLRAGGEVIQASIQSMAPIRPTLPSGTALPEGALSRDIELHIGKEDGKWSAIIRPGSETAYVANFVEYGHRQVSGGYSKLLPSGRHRGGGKQIGDVPAHPFIRPGFEVAAEAAIEAAKAAIIEGIEKAAGTR